MIDCDNKRNETQTNKTSAQLPLIPVLIIILNFEYRKYLQLLSYTCLLLTNILILC